MEYPTYLIHYGTLGQKWGVRRYQNEDGTYTPEGLERRRVLEGGGASREGYKQLKKSYRENVKGSTKEFNKIRRESGVDKLVQNRQKQYDAIDKVDSYAYKRASELFDEYKDLKMYKAKLKGKEFDTSKIGVQSYFGRIGIDVGPVFNMSMPAIIEYTARHSNKGTKVTKQMYTSN